MSFLQETIHKLEVGGGMRYFRYALVLLAAALLIVAYNLRAAKNMGTQEAMDAAQLARNISEGKGYTTLFIRPLSMHLIAERNQAKHGLPEPGKLADYSRIREAHPDIANPPVYPVVLAGLMKIAPFEYEITQSRNFWSTQGRFWRYQPDFLIGWFNQLLFLCVVAMVFLWARRLFDNTVAATSAILLFGSELFWRFSASGLSTMLLLVIFMGLVWCLTVLEREQWEPKRPPAALIALAAIIGLLTGLGMLTRYGFGWLIIPVALFVAFFGGARRWLLSGVVVTVFLLVTVPWVIRNFDVSGTPFGTAGYALVEGTTFSDHTLQRSMNPEIKFGLTALRNKLLVNTRQILEEEFFTLGSGWIQALFLVGLLIGFRSPTIRRTRLFLVGCMAVLFLVQALGRTQLSEDSKVINSENYLVLLVPLTIVFAVSMFYLLLDQLDLPNRQFRYGVMGAFALLVYLPLILVLLPPRNYPIVLPYSPPSIQQTAEWMRPNELMMSDVPWAVAWYGNRQCVWLTLEAFKDPGNPDSEDHFYAINDFQKLISGIYLSPKTMDLRLQSDVMRSGPAGWGNFVVSTLFRREVPPGFPLKEIAPQFGADQMFLTDWKRW